MLNTDNKARLIALLLAVCTAAGITACGDSSDNTEQTTTDDTTTAEVTSAAEFTPASFDFGGEDFNIFLWNLNQLAYESETGDVINDAVYRRNRKVQDIFNVNFKYNISPLNWSQFDIWTEVLNSSILAGDNEIQLAGGYGYRLARYSLSGNFHNLNDLSTMDFSKPWWPANINEVGNIGNKFFIALGNIDPLYYDSTYAMFFNKKIADENKINDMYSLVDSGKWTIDKLAEYSKRTSMDVNGDATMNAGDRYGAIFETNMAIDSFIQACDIKITQKDKNDIPKLIGLTEKYISVYDFLDNYLKDSGDVLYAVYNDVKDEFFNGLGFMTGADIGSAHKYRQMEDDFGIIPYPKYDEAQERYISYNALGNATTFIIPITADGEKSGAILEALAYYGYRDVLPEYYERALKGKGTRDDESSAMLDIIFDNIEFDFTQIYSASFGDLKAPSMVLRMGLKNNQEIVSYWAADEAMYDATMEELINTLK